ncbi:MAG: transcription termination factor Rho [Puniceicoccales bacterium]|jgi:transcription termination factor Rho|nr:transcription termination factor Rho [Puniceicoccales bacterium]
MKNEMNASVDSQEVGAVKRPTRMRRSRISTPATEKGSDINSETVDVSEQFSSKSFDGELSYSFHDEESAPHEEWQPSSTLVASVIPEVSSTADRGAVREYTNATSGNGKRNNGNRNRRNFQNQHQVPEQRRDNRSQNQLRNHQKFIKTMRIGQFNTGQMKNLECFESIEKLEELAQDSIDFSKEEFNFNEYSTKEVAQLLREMGVTRCACGEMEDIKHAPNSRVFDVIIGEIFANKRPIVAHGILESIEGGDGLIVYGSDNYRIKPQSAFVPKILIQRYGLRRGQEITVYLHPSTQNSTCPFVIKVKGVMGNSPETVCDLPKFKDLLPYYPTERLFLEANESVPWSNQSMRIVDLLSPIGLGQRGLIVAPPRTGKTVLLQGIANAISMNRPDVNLIILLVDERPEEVTDFRRQVPSAEIISSTFDESADNHVHAADIVIDKARRKVEAGQHVVILLDSITRLARAHNVEQPSSGKLLSGGIDANALRAPKRFFGSARNIEGGGSLTILATALVDTGSKMDEVIFEEFKGTGNMELHLDRSLVEKRIFPAINIEKSGTRKEELLYHPDELEKVYTLRRAIKGLPLVEAMEMLMQRARQTKSNTEFLLSINR